MHTKLSSDNPHGYTRWGFAWEHVPEGIASHLDFGCFDGAFLNSLAGKNIGRLAGVDISGEAVSKAKSQFPELEIIKINKAAALPFDDAAFNSVSILDVLEHVYEQAELLAELNRVLKDRGRLIVTVPGRHLFSFLDMGNLKFRFPRLHRWYYCLRHSRADYEQRYVSNPDGLIGDVSSRKRWHEHFSRRKLTKLLEKAGFRVIVFDGTGFFSRIISNVSYFLRWCGPAYKALMALKETDANLFESTNLFCIAEKKPSL
ncbi:MAG: class I SAM-dependent methyltransferase [Sedimentisphaerales bacterium]|jgi:SAM-dependent methyltransferase|nr:class I SAM-dependent methyltransferase [Sedimentisphaerales bacterium]